ncbi:MAG TPA: type I DNA topoisomerase [Candidatus Paceibacterota bacterium]|nr:type I DNA topoisomerase [Candidatus Paceibacterota bacterium]
MKLVIVESPTKAKTIARYLGDEYVVRSSYGHVRDLPKSELGIDVEHNFKPEYVVPTKAKKNLSELKKEAAKADAVILATDPDREGEAIAWHLVQALGLNKPKTKKPTERIAFHEITETAIKKALGHPGIIDEQLVDAQQARRILDRLVGYKVSPVLWKRYWRGLSAGRVQSVALRFIVEREREIQAFIPTEYWSLTAALSTSAGAPLEAQLASRDGAALDKLAVPNEAEAKAIVNELNGASWTVADVERTEMTRMPHAPFTTSTLQQESNRRLHYSSRQTMTFAQGLYEAGYITYMRTDSVNLSEEALVKAKEFIGATWGDRYHTRRKFRTKSKSAQEAHEAVRPTDPARTPESLAGDVSPQQLKVYDLIWRRYLASQMTEAKFDTASINITAGRYGFRANGSVMRFDGWLKVYPTKVEDAELPDIHDGEPLTLRELRPEQHFTKPPARFNEASLIKMLEKEGIGRPSTYASIISTILLRKYVEKDRSRALIPSEIGMQVNDFLVENFPRIVDVQFTSHLEDELDEIANGKRKWIPTVRDFYTPLAEQITEKMKMAKEAKASEVETTDKTCELCGSPMVVKRGRFGKFIACSNFPTCRNVLKEDKVKKEVERVGRVCPLDGGELVYRTSRFGKFIACSNFPKCRYTEKIAKEKPAAEETAGTTDVASDVTPAQS